MVVILAAVLAASPVTVRVLEREHPVKAHLEAKQLTCDGRPLPASADLEVAVREVKVGAELCNEVIATDATVKLNELQRSYPGALHVVLEGGFLRFINEVDVEAYLPSVVAGELSGAPASALEAQAVVSRTFALTSPQRHELSGYQLCDLAHCQLYRGRTEETAEARAAVEKTRGQVLLVGGVVFRPTFFHSSCGGHTSRAQDVFKEEEGAGPGVSDVEKGAALCAEAPDFAWEWTIDRLELARGLGLNGKPDVAAFEPLRRDPGGRLIELKAFGKRFAASEFRSAVGRAFGWQTLRSLKVTASQADHLVTFRGTGLGHGVGLCQQGARALAAKGADAKTILKRYFPDSQVRPAPTP